MKKAEEKDRREKEIENIRWDYLMQNDKFMRLWQIWREREKRRPLGDSTVPVPDELMFMDRQYHRLHRRGTYYYRNKESYFFYHDPSEASFEGYWEYRKTGIGKSRSIGLVEDFPAKLGTYIDQIVNTFSKKLSREDLKDYLVNSLMSTFGKIYLGITQQAFTHKEADKIINLVSEKIRKRIPDKRFKQAELRRYLEVYKLKKRGMKYREIFDNKLVPHYQNHTWEVARIELVNDYSKAEKIMSNIETDIDLRFYW